MWDAARVYCWTTDGRKICTAELDGNAMDYFPLSQIEAARERRATGKVSRLVEKIGRVAPGATVQLPETPATYTMMADSITRPEPILVAPPALEADPVIQTAAPQQSTPAKRPVFTSMQDRYAWLMHNPDAWTGKDSEWMANYVAGNHYADMHTYYEARCIAWPGYVQQSKR